MGSRVYAFTLTPISEFFTQALNTGLFAEIRNLQSLGKNDGDKKQITGYVESAHSIPLSTSVANP